MHHTVYVTLGKRLDFMCARQALYQLGTSSASMHTLYVSPSAWHVCVPALLWTCLYKMLGFCVKAALGIKILNIHSPE